MRGHQRTCCRKLHRKVYKKEKQIEQEIIKRSNKMQANGPVNLNRVDDMFTDVEQSFVALGDDDNVLNETFREYQKDLMMDHKDDEERQQQFPGFKPAGNRRPYEAKPPTA